MTIQRIAQEQQPAAPQRAVTKGWGTVSKVAMGAFMAIALVFAQANLAAAQGGNGDSRLFKQKDCSAIREMMPLFWNATLTRALTESEGYDPRKAVEEMQQLTKELLDSEATNP